MFFLTELMPYWQKQVKGVINSYWLLWSESGFIGAHILKGKGSKLPPYMFWKHAGELNFYKTMTPFVIETAFRQIYVLVTAFCI